MKERKIHISSRNDIFNATPVLLHTREMHCTAFFATYHAECLEYIARLSQFTAAIFNSCC